MQRLEVQRIAAGRLAAAEDIWVGAALGDMLDEAGDVDEAKVGRVIGELLSR